MSIPEALAKAVHDVAQSDEWRAACQSLADGAEKASRDFAEALRRMERK